MTSTSRGLRTAAAHKVVDVGRLPGGIAVGQRVVGHKVDLVLVDVLLGDDPWRIGDDLVHPPVQVDSGTSELQGKLVLHRSPTLSTAC